MTTATTSVLFQHPKGQNSREFLENGFLLPPRVFLEAYFRRCSTYGSLHAGLALRLLASNQHCDTLQECRLLTCSLLLMASSETRVDLPFALFRLAYLFPLFPPSASTCHDTHEDLAMRLARPGEIVVDTEEIFLEELLCDPVPDRTVVACRNVASCYSAPASWSPADE